MSAGDRGPWVWVAQAKASGLPLHANVEKYYCEETAADTYNAGDYEIVKYVPLTELEAVRRELSQRREVK